MLRKSILRLSYAIPLVKASESSEEKPLWKQMWDPKKLVKGGPGERDENLKQIYQFIEESEEPWERVKIYLKNLYNFEQTVDNQMLSTGLQASMLLGLVGGATVGNKQLLENLVWKYNEHTWRGQWEGRKVVRNEVYLSSATRGISSMWRLTSFTFLFVVSTSLASTYRNDIWYRDFALAGASVGAFWRTRVGPRAMVGAGLLGSVCGLIYASVWKAFLYLTDTTLPEFRRINAVNYQINMLNKRKVMNKKALEENKEDAKLLLAHDERMEKEQVEQEF